jgi:hypothetical protein
MSAAVRNRALRPANGNESDAPRIAGSRIPIGFPKITAPILGPLLIRRPMRHRSAFAPGDGIVASFVEPKQFLLKPIHRLVYQAMTRPSHQITYSSLQTPSSPARINS